MSNSMQAAMTEAVETTVADETTGENIAVDVETGEVLDTEHADVQSVFDGLELMDQSVKDIVTFSLTNKVAHRVVTASMSLANRRRQEAKLAEIGGVEAFNEFENAIDEEAASNDWFNAAGKDVETLPPEQELLAWVSVWAHLSDNSFEISPLADAYKFRMTGAAEQASSDIDDPAELAKLAADSGCTVAEVKKARHSAGTRQVGGLKDILIEGFRLAREVTPRDVHQLDLPEKWLTNYREMVSDSFKSARKAQLKIAKSNDELLATFTLMQREEDMF